MLWQNIISLTNKTNKPQHASLTLIKIKLIGKKKKKKHITPTHQNATSKESGKGNIAVILQFKESQTEGTAWCDCCDPTDMILQLITQSSKGLSPTKT